MLTTTQAAAALRLTERRVRQLIASGALPATKHGRDWLIMEADLNRAESRPPVGYPKGRARRRSS